MDAPFILQLILYYENNRRILFDVEREALVHLRELLAKVALAQLIPTYLESGDR